MIVRVRFTAASSSRRPQLRLRQRVGDRRVERRACLERRAPLDRRRCERRNRRTERRECLRTRCRLLLDAGRFAIAEVVLGLLRPVAQDRRGRLRALARVRDAGALQPLLQRLLGRADRAVDGAADVTTCSSTQSPVPPSLRRAAVVAVLQFLADVLRADPPRRRRSRRRRRPICCARTVSPLLSRPLPAATPMAAMITIDAEDTGADDRQRSHHGVTSRLRQLVDDADEQPPEALDGRDAHALVGRVRRLDLRAERDHVEPCDLVADDRRLEAGVHGGDDRRLAEQPLVRPLRRCERR